MTIFTNKNIPLDQLTRSGANVRGVGKAKGADTLAASIKAQGLIQPLVVHKVAAGYAVVAGGRRLAALTMLADAGEWDAPVPCRVIEKGAPDDMHAAVSFAENDGQLPMHPLDRMRVLQQFVRKGWDAAKIGTSFGIPAKTVAQTLKLATLALPIRKAFAEGEIDLDEALAFATCTDTARQLRVFENEHWYNVKSLRSRLRTSQTPGTTDMNERARFFGFVGDEAYESAGGTFEADMFTPMGERKVNGALVMDLAKAKLEQAALDIKEEHGLDWCQVSLYEHPHNNHLSRWDDDVDACPVEVGGVVWVGFRGQLQSDGPFVRTADFEVWEAKQRAAQADGEETDEHGAETVTPDSDTAQDPVEPEIDPDTLPKDPSRAMNKDAGEALTGAIAAAVSADFDAAFDLFLSNMLGEARGFYQAKRLLRSLPSVHRTPALEAIVEGMQTPDADHQTDLVAAMDTDQKQALFAALVGGMVEAGDTDFMGHPTPKPRKGAVELATRLGVNMRTDWEEQDRTDYLNRMTKYDLAHHVLGLDGDELKEAIAANDKATMVVRALDADWVPQYFVGADGPAELDTDDTDPQEVEGLDVDADETDPQEVEQAPVPIAAE